MAGTDLRRSLPSQGEPGLCARQSAQGCQYSTMPPRVIAFLLAFVLLCSGFAVPEQAIAAATQNAEQAHDRTVVRRNDVRPNASAPGRRGSAAVRCKSDVSRDIEYATACVVAIEYS